MNARKAYGPRTSRVNDHLFVGPRPDATAAPPVAPPPPPAPQQPKRPTKPGKPGKPRSASLRLTITEGDVSTLYAVMKLPSADPTYRLTKDDGTAYVLRCDSRAGRFCSCPGFGFHHKCRHIDALTAFGLLPESTPAPAADAPLSPYTEPPRFDDL